MRSTLIVVLAVAFLGLGCSMIPHPRYPDYMLDGSRNCARMHPADCARSMKRRAPVKPAKALPKCEFPEQHHTDIGRLTDEIAHGGAGYTLDITSEGVGAG